VSSLRAHTYCYSQGASNARVLSIFFPSPAFEDETLDSTLLDAIAAHAVFDAVHIVGDTCAVDRARELMTTNTPLRARLDGAVRNLDHVLRETTFDSSRCQFRVAGSAVSPDQEAFLIEIERRFWLWRAFVSTGALVRAPQGLHYRKTSGRHSAAFLRAANVLEDGPNISALAFWLLGIVAGKKIQRIVVDTSGIAAVAVAVGHEAVKRGLFSIVPTFETHRSYEGLEKLRISQPAQTLVLVSASTSDGLVEKLIENGADHQNIVTLFYGGKPQSKGNVLCDLRAKPDLGFEGIDHVESFDEQSCDLCRRGSIPVKIAGDQFMLEPPRIEEVRIAREDLPADQYQKLNDLAGRRIFRTFRRTEGRDHEIFLDSECAFASRDEWEKFVKRGLPVHISRIVYDSLPCSRALAERARNIVPLEWQGRVTLLTSRDLRTIEPAPGSATLVVSACIDDIAELLAINRDLRTVQARGDASYVSPFFRAPDRAERLRVQSNLTYGDRGPGSFSLFAIHQLQLPRCDLNHSWLQELRTLERASQWADLAGVAIPAAVDARLARLRVAPSEGLIDDLFWTSPRGVQLGVHQTIHFLTPEEARRGSVRLMCLSRLQPSYIDFDKGSRASHV
jgi:hypothetical protein